jgi:hypothetical protein
MVTFEMPYKLILPLKNLLTEEAHMGQQLHDVLMAQKISAGFILHGLHDQTICINLQVSEVVAHLKRRVKVAQMLLQAMLRQEDLAA